MVANMKCLPSAGQVRRAIMKGKMTVMLLLMIVMMTIVIHCQHLPLKPQGEF